MRRAAVLGSPIAHSLSPVLHRAAYAELGLADEWSYERIECDEAGLAGFLKTRDDSWAGLSLTMPLKRAAMDLAHDADSTSREVGVANTLLFDSGRLLARNTDVAGVTGALREAGITRVRTAAVLGGGATAASAVAALGRLGAVEPGAITVLARDPARAEGVVRAAERMSLHIATAPLSETAGRVGVDLVVSTLPAGAADLLAEAVAAGPAALFDVVYSPWPTVLAGAVAAAGRPVVGGFPMLLHQAAIQVELMTGAGQAPIEAMRRAGEAELLRRAAAGE
ncbi:shikimate dehydrogenase [Nocardiopsis sediminis]|uniref:Shikimate dehydrogenase n=1 Tax=Nocardiopsis sediminis TaxID=1778267 RepID=A0ABV8FK82_9ACTN